MKLLFPPANQWWFAISKDALGSWKMKQMPERLAHHDKEEKERDSPSRVSQREDFMTSWDRRNSARTSRAVVPALNLRWIQYDRTPLISEREDLGRVKEAARAVAIELFLELDKLATLSSLSAIVSGWQRKRQMRWWSRRSYSGWRWNPLKAEKDALFRRPTLLLSLLYPASTRL